jgi:DNA processing protein
MIGPPSDSHAGTDAAARRELVLCLHFCSGVGSVLGRRVAQAVRSVDDLHAGGTDLLRGLPGIGSHRARAVVQSIAAARARIEAEHALARDQGAALIAWGDADYPPLLAELPDAPLALFVRGRLTPTDDRGQRRAFGVAMVGSRRATAYGIEQTERFAAALAGAGLDIISGGARGIDAAAHRAALRAGGRTIAVMGCGLARCYPPEHASLYDEIVERGGAVVSELPMNTEPHARHFPERNRIISGLSLGVLDRKSVV